MLLTTSVWQKKEAEFQDLEQDVKPETSPIELKQLPSGL
jgi:hypothetical protein